MIIPLPLLVTLSPPDFRSPRVARMLGGLLGGHSMAVAAKNRQRVFFWYEDHLLRLAEDLGRRLLPAFNRSALK